MENWVKMCTLAGSLNYREFRVQFIGYVRRKVIKLTAIKVKKSS